jgi:MYXO-CTERM domain-containing protein
VGPADTRTQTRPEARLNRKAPVQKLVTSAAVAAGLLWGSTASGYAYVRIYPNKDTVIYSEDSSRDSGQSASIYIGSTGTAARRTLMSFPVTSYIPSGSSIQFVYLYLYMTGIPAPVAPAVIGYATIYAHRITSPWIEGLESVAGNPIAGCSSDPPACVYPTATGSSPTWSYQYYPSTLWTGGAPVYGNASAYWSEDATVGGYKFFSDLNSGGAGLVYDVQQWVNFSLANNGWMLYAYPATTPYSARIFDSRTGANSPFIDVYYYKPLGYPCGGGTECSNGYCVNGVCCSAGSCSNPECQFGATCNGSSPGYCTTSNYGPGTACTSDGNNCTVDHCSSGSCVHDPGNAGTACPDDGNPCTADQCNGVSSACQHPAGNPGTACADDGNPCTFDQCNGSSTTCAHPANNAGSCTDGNACTTDTCSGGSCVSGPPNSCPAIDQCHNAGTCNPADGVCSTPIKANGTPCTIDANPCTADQCQAGVCTAPAGNAGAACATDNNPCTVDQCNGSSTACQHTPGNAGVQCSGPSCACPGGVCSATLPATCTGSSATCPTASTVNCGGALCSGNVCAGGCIDDTGCSAGNFCLGGQCKPKRANGDPLGCAGSNYCQSNNCVDGYCCNNACPGGTTDCQACNVAGALGTCSPLPANTLCRAQSGECDALDRCNGTGTTCVDGKQTNGTACTDDGNLCTTDTCQAGVCAHAAGNQGLACHASAGACDVVETCPGAGNSTCPADGYSSSTTPCRTASCSGGVQTNAANCTGSGPTCPAVVTKACAPYVCGATACKTSCTANTDCSAGNWCNAGICVPKVANGNACTSGVSCISGICADGVCCNASCGGACEACDVATKVGTCSPVVGPPHGSRTPCASDGSLCGGACNGTTRTACTYPTGTQCRAPSCAGASATLGAVCTSAGACPAIQTQDCGEYICSGTACRGDCNSEGDCAPGSYCSARVCKPKLDKGAACGSDNQCKTGHCVDKFCCDQSCDSQCQACDIAGEEGTCSPVTGPPHGGRAPCASDGTLCAGRCDGTQVSACAYPGDGVVCHDATCVSDTATLLSYCNGAGACPPEQRQPCGQFVCNAAGTLCEGDCLVDRDCGNGFCSGGVCSPLLQNGQACASGSQCNSAYCVDGVCCNGPCPGQCEACNQQGSEGTCRPVTGPPTGIRPACATDGSPCGGTCDGATTTRCLYPDKAQSCRAASCTDGVATLATSCSGDGRCPVVLYQSCGSNSCSGTICGGGCTSDANCTATQFCAGGVCIGKLANGLQCSTDTQCDSAHCVDGFCCDTACTSQCQACDVIPNVGKCTTVPAGGQPHGGRQPCAGVSACAATCDGVKTNACTFPDRSKTCGLALCLNGVETQASTCNGQGTCLATANKTCEPYLCDTTGGVGQCATTCTTADSCVPGFGCVNGVCVFGASRDAGPGDAAADAGSDGGGAVGGAAGATGTGGRSGGTSGGATSTAGAGGSAGAMGTGGGSTVTDAGADAAVDGGPDAGKEKPAAAAAGDDGGCGCRVGSNDRAANAAWPLAGLMLLGLRRLRRGRQASI